MSETITETVRTTLESLQLEDPHRYDYSNLSPYVNPPETKEELPWAELVTLDLEDYGRRGSKARLAKQLKHAVHHVGFFYVKNFGLSQEQVDQQFTLAKHFFALDTEEKAKHEVDYVNADYNGWRRAGRGQNGATKDTVEIFNIPKYIKDFEGKHTQPDLIKAHLPDIEVFARALHSNVHTYEKKSEDHYRYMIYRKRTPEEHAASGFGHSTGHTDLGTVTLLFRQPIAVLQILGEDGKWTYVSAQPGTITVNLADTISHITGEWLKSSVHRVVAPPEDQWAYDRTELLYFARPHNDTVLEPILDSPVLSKAGVKSRFEKEMTMEQWVKAKQTMQ